MYEVRHIPTLKRFVVALSGSDNIVFCDMRLATDMTSAHPLSRHLFRTKLAAQALKKKLDERGHLPLVPPEFSEAFRKAEELE